MFKDVVVLNKAQHAALRFDPAQGYAFAAQQILCPIGLAEATHVAREMPIVFPLNNPLPHALLGFEQHKNLHVHTTGQWIGRYIPAHIRRYPFVLAADPAQTDADVPSARRFVLLFADNAPHLGDVRGARLFDDAGEPSETLKQVQKVLGAVQRDMEMTQRAVAMIERMGLLQAKPVVIQQADGRHAVEGVRVVDPVVLRALSGEQLVELEHGGGLELIYAHLASLINLKDGWLAQAKKQLASPTKGNAPSDEVDLDAFDWSAFNGHDHRA